jgi:hypothetical protein
MESQQDIHAEIDKFKTPWGEIIQTMKGI